MTTIDHQENPDHEKEGENMDNLEGQKVEEDDEAQDIFVNNIKE